MKSIAAQTSSLTELIDSVRTTLREAVSITSEFEEDQNVDDDVAATLGELHAWLNEAITVVGYAGGSNRQLQSLLKADVVITLGMNTHEGDRLLLARLEDLEHRCRSGELVRGRLEGEVSRLINLIERAGHPEVWTPEIRGSIYETVDAICDHLLWRRLYE